MKSLFDRSDRAVKRRLMQNANGEALEDGFSCTEATIKGVYGVEATGYRLTGVGSYVPFGVANWRNFDGNGNFTGVGINNVNGTFANVNYHGTYTVNRDCTVEIDEVVISTEGVVRNLSESGIIVDKGREILALQTSPDDNIVSSVLKKVR
ncbi:hypothetical protein [Scytonema sp. NUACC26]|uniref:hypothetical protein n=1 Tax=Scytonema sp. NUACC26 TaxID=3140176 RepID=UPI0034DC4E9F